MPWWRLGIGRLDPGGLMRPGGGRLDPGAA